MNTSRKWRLLLQLALFVAAYVHAQQLESQPDTAEPLEKMAAMSKDVQPPLQMNNDLLQYLSDANEALNASRYLPGFLYDTDWMTIGSAFQDACLATYETVRLWIVFFALLMVPIVQGATVLGEVLLPHFITLLKIIADYVSEMDPVNQAVLVISLVLIAICVKKGYIRKARLRYVKFRRHTEQRYRDFVDSLSEKSRVVAIALPHVLFFAFAYGIHFWLPDILLEILSNEALFGILSMGYPLIRSIIVIRHRRIYRPQSRSSVRTIASTAPTQSRNVRAQRRNTDPGVLEWRSFEPCLKYWVLWSFAGCLTGMITLFLPAFVISFVSLPLNICNIFLIWIHSPFTRGDVALYTLVSPLISPYANRFRDMAESRAGHENEASNFAMRALVTLGIVPERHVHFLKDLWSQGPALAGLMFIFTPGFVTSRGCTLVGFGFPAYVTMDALGEKRTRSYEWWLSYFCAAVSVDYLITAIGRELSWLPLFYHAKLLLMMWLQFPYFRGAEMIFDACFYSIFIVPERKED